MADDIQTGDLQTGATVTAPVQTYAPLTAQDSPPPRSKPLDIPDVVELPHADPQKAQAGMEKALQAGAAAASGTEARIERMRVANDRIMDQMIQRQSDIIPDLSKQWNSSAEMAKREPSIWEKFGSPAFVFAMLGSAFSAQPMNAALMAGGAAMQAMNEGAWADYKAHFDAWKENTKLAIERGKMEHEIFSDVLSKQSSDLNAFNSEMRAALAASNHKSALALLEAGMLPELNQAIEGHNKALLETEKARVGIIENEAKRQAITNTEEFKRGDAMGVVARAAEFEMQLNNAKNNKSVQAKMQSDAWINVLKTPEGARKFYQMTPDKQEATRVALATYHPEYTVPDQPSVAERPPGVSESTWDAMGMLYMLDSKSVNLQGYGKEATAYRQALQLHGMEMLKAQGMEPGDLVARKAEVHADSLAMNRIIQMQSNVDAFSRFTARNGDYLVQLAQKVNPSGVPVYNRWVNAGRQDVAGDPEVSMFNNMLRTYRQDVNNIITNANLSSRLSVFAMKEGKEFLRGGETAKQIYHLNNMFKGEFGQRSQEFQSEVDELKARISGKVFKRPEQPSLMPPIAPRREDIKVQFDD